MATIAIPTFAGEVPRTTPRLLEGTQASVAINCRLQRGALEPLTGPAKEAPLSLSAKTIFKHPVDGWLAWEKEVSVVKSAIVDVAGEKPLGHLFVTGDRPYPTQYFTGGGVYRLGIPRPTTAPTVEIESGAAENTVVAYAFGANSDADIPARYGAEHTLTEIQDTETATVNTFADITEDTEDDSDIITDAGISRSSIYVYTYVQSLADGIFQQESAPSPASILVDVFDGDGVKLSGFEVPTDEGLNITHIRIYRTVAGMETSEFHFLTELEVPVESYIDTTHDVDISSDVLATATWDAIPDDAQGLIYADNGLYVCFRGNEVLISEPFHAYVFPTDYRLAVEDTVVALAHVDGTIVILTTGRPYLASGAEPGSLQVTHLPIEQACVSARSVGHLPGGVVYASPDGLMLFTSGEQTLLTGQTWTREQWQALCPETLLGTVHDSRYVGFFAGTNRGFLFSLGAKDVVNVELPKEWEVMDVYHHSNDDCVYLSVDTPEGSGVYKMESGEPMPYTWRSKPFFTSALTSMSAIRIEGEQTPYNPVTVRVFGPDTKRCRARIRLTDSRAKRLPATRSEKVWSVEIVGKATVYDARIGGSVEGVEYGS